MSELRSSGFEGDIEFEVHINGGKSGPVQMYKAHVIYSSLEALIDCAGKEVSRRIQQKLRAKVKFPTDKRFTVDESGEYTMSDREAVAMMSDEQLEARMLLYAEQMEARKKAQAAALEEAAKEQAAKEAEAKAEAEAEAKLAAAAKAAEAANSRRGSRA